MSTEVVSVGRSGRDGDGAIGTEGLTVTELHEIIDSVLRRSRG